LYSEKNNNPGHKTGLLKIIFIIKKFSKMKLKKKVIFGMIAGLFTVATVFNMNILNKNGAGDVSLDAVSVMAKASIEGGDKGTLYGNQSGTSFCCAPGSNSCSAAPC
jgi:hypothetical protein